ncbi:hypothetical protein E2C01_005351 [Portunus trituberculatus]|uniref:Uncharacterized protein n=1 Tax=Portunus trituberculatus TaxID=210409 RepID=A0A5B7CSA7_PORTR|nr:hypothetical protein [Portunus trituberculatus]
MLSRHEADDALDFIPPRLKDPELMNTFFPSRTRVTSSSDPSALSNRRDRAPHPPSLPTQQALFAPIPTHGSVFSLNPIMQRPLGLNFFSLTFLKRVSVSKNI